MSASRPIPIPMPDSEIRPVSWRSCFPGLSSDLGFIVDQNDSTCVSKLRKLAADETLVPERRYRAIGYLVALQNRGVLEASDLIQFFENIARAAEKPAHSQTRQDALFAIAHLEEKYQPHPQAVRRLIELAKDPNLQSVKRETLAALAVMRDPATLDLLASGVVEFGGLNLAGGMSEIDSPWQDKANRIIHALQSSLRPRNQLDVTAILQAFSTRDQPPTRRQELEEVFIEAARDPKNQDERMSGILAGLLIACEAGDAEPAGHRINAYQRDHKVPEDQLRNLRLQVGGKPALSSVLQSNFSNYFQQPIEELHKNTLAGWQTSLRNAHLGFVVRLWMSIAVFAIGLLLLGASSYKLLSGGSNRLESLAPFAAGLGTMLLIIYAGPLKDIRQSVTDLATANAVFIAYVHRILETSHTFSFYYLKEQITFEEMAKSSSLIKEAMDNTIRSLNMTAIDSSEDVIVRAMTFATDKLKKT